MIPLRTILIVNAVSSGITGIGLIALSSYVSNLFEVSSVTPFTGVGVLLVLFAAFVLTVGTRKNINPKAVRLIIRLDTLWVVGSIILVAVASGAISLTGLALIIGVAVWVGAMAVLQHKGLTSASAVVLSLMCILFAGNTNCAAQSTRDMNGSNEVEMSREAVDAESTSLAVVSEFLQAVKEMNGKKAASVLDSLIQWDQPGHNRFSGTKKNLQEVFLMFHGFNEMSGATLRLTEVKVLATNKNTVACHLHWTAAQPTGNKLDVDNIDIYTVENGKIVKAVVYTADTEQEDRFWSK